MPIVNHPEPEAEAPQRLPGENPASNPRAVIGGNEPPLEERIGMEFNEALLSERPDFKDRMKAAIEAVGRAVVTDDETLGKAGDLERILRACEGHIGDVHKTVKQPYLDGGRAVDAAKNRLIESITPARMKLRDMMNGYLAEKQAKERAAEQARQAAARAAAEAAARVEREAREAEEAAARAVAEAKTVEERANAEALAVAAALEAEEKIALAQLAAAPTAKSEPVRSDAGATVSGRKVWVHEIVDFELAFMAVSGNEKVREAIDKAIGQRVKSGDRQIAGVKIWDTVAAVAR